MISNTHPDRHRPLYHHTPLRGWLNDPNGLAFHKGRFHIHYQYNPHAARWGDIHWAHASSADLVHWRDEGMALTPTPGYDQDGCFSGCYALVNGQHTLFYTGVAADKQVQCVATSGDLQKWVKQPQRTIVSPPADVAPADFRDPYTFKLGAWWYMVVGASLRGERGQTLLYRSEDGIAWQYRHPLYTAPDLALGVMWECPNFFPLGDRWVLTVSVWPNLSAHAFVGRFEDERFIPESSTVLDVDAGAFAHLAMRAPDGRTLQWAWLNEQRDQAHIDAGQWAGALSVPRELNLDGQGRLNMRPVSEITLLRQGLVPIVSTGEQRGTLCRFTGRCLDIEALFTLRDSYRVGLTLMASSDGREYTRIVFWPSTRRISIERARSSTDDSVRRQDLHALLCLDTDEPLRLRVLLDHSVLEVYANDRVCLSTRIYPAAETSVNAQAFVEGDAQLELRAWRMGPMHLEPRTDLSTFSTRVEEHHV